ncbi:hypothetical protein ACHQM5_019975 [Ranunculus cassubicifolius]
MIPIQRRIHAKFLHRSYSSWHSQSLTQTLSHLSIQGRLSEAINLLRQTPNSNLNSDSYLSLIRSCIKFKEFTKGKEIHKHVIESRVQPSLALQNNIMMLYAKSGEPDLAHKVFDEMSERNMFTWTAIIGAYSNTGGSGNGSGKAIGFYEEMILAGIKADNFVYPLVLKACGGMKNLRKGRRVHGDVLRSGFSWDLVIMNSLIDMYAKCEGLSDAERVFYECDVRDIFTWTSMLVGYVQWGCGLEALELFKEMMCSDVRPCSATFSGILPIFSDLGCLETAKQIHGLVIVNGCGYDKFIGNALIDVYGNCGGLGFGRIIFDRVKNKDVVCWNTMIKGCVQVGQFYGAMRLFKQMAVDGISPNSATMRCMIPLYLQSRVGVLELIDELEQMELSPSIVSTLLLDMYEHIDDIILVKELDKYLSRSGYKSNNSVAVALIRMYFKFAYVEAAQEIFNAVSVKDLDCWNAMIECYAQNNYIDKALEQFDSMRDAGFEPDILSWKSVIAGLVQDGDIDSALHMFSDMIWLKQKNDLKNFDLILPLIQSNTRPLVGKALHCLFLRNEYKMRTIVCTAFINMYGKCRDVAYAVKLFNSMKSKDLVSWNAIISSLAKNGYLAEASNTFHEMKKMGVKGSIITWTTLILGYARNGQVDESLKHFRELQLEGLKPNAITIASILPACAQLAALYHGKSIYGYIVRSGLEDDDLIVSNALIDMFVKSGCMEYAERVFWRIPQRDVVSWNTMIQGFAINGRGKDSLSLFNQMITEGVAPNYVTFIGVLNACSHAGLVDEGWKQFNCMESKYGITPSGKHYACMVDILGRAGQFEDVRDFIVQMPLQPTASLWGALLSACKTHGNLEMAEYAANHLIELQPENPGNYVVLSNIYARARRWDDVDRVRKMMVSHGVKKLPGGSWIEIGNDVHAFAVEDMGKQEMDEMNTTLVDLAALMREEGYVPDGNSDSFDDVAEA